MKHLRKPYLIISIIITILLTSCSTTTSTDITDCTIQNTLEYLTSDECAGRLPGTEGNILAQDYIVNMLKLCGVKPYGESYLHPYTDTLNQIINDKVSLKLKQADGKEASFTYGKDFVEIGLKKENITLPLYTKPRDNEDCILLLDGLEYYRDYKDNDSVKGMLIKYDQLIVSSPSQSEEEDTISSFKVLPNVYEKLRKNIGQPITMSMNYVRTNIELNNIIGKIDGKSHDKAIVITAHFDHVGSIGNNIWRGADDNASGISVLIDIAKKLSEYSKDNKLDCDIIFSPVNDEEASMHGSPPVASLLQNDYPVLYNINFDCIGEKGRDSVIIDNSGNENMKLFSEELVDFLNEHNVKSSLIPDYGTGDHISFHDSILATTGYGEYFIHTTEDTIDKVDIEYCEKIATVFADFLKDFTFTDEYSKSSDLVNSSIKIMHPQFDEFKFVKCKNKIHYMDGTYLDGTKDELNKAFKTDLSFIPDSINDTILKEIFLYAPRNPENNNEFDEQKYKLDTIYKKEVTAKCIQRIDIDFINSDHHIFLNLGFYRKSNPFDMESFDMDFKEKSDIKVATKNKKYYMLHTEDKQLMDTLVYINDNGTDIYTANICGNSIDGTDLDKTKEFVEKNIEPLIDNFIKFMSNLNR